MEVSNQVTVDLKSGTPYPHSKRTPGLEQHGMATQLVSMTS
jgi:hypothetical protein